MERDQTSETRQTSEMNERRQLIRNNIKSDAKNLCMHVVNTCIEYKEELLQLEKDNIKLVRKNKNLERRVENLEEQSQMLMEELERCQERIKKILENIASKNTCYNCDHFTDCRDIYLCVYCQKWVCSCCIDFCSKEYKNESEMCNVCICISCFSTKNKCPLDSLTPDSENLMRFYKENRLKKYTRFHN